MRNGLTTIQDGLDDSLKLLHSRVMEDGAMALAVEYKGEIVVTRLYLTDLIGYLQEQGTMGRGRMDAAMVIPPKLKLKMEIFTKDYYVVEKDKYDELTYHQSIPQYKGLQLEKK